MYKIQNSTPGSLPLQLEKGSITLQKNWSFDLDTVCSRKWINSDPILRNLIAAGHIRVIHDSEKGVRKAPTKGVLGPKAKKAKKDTPVIIDFSNVPEPEEIAAAEDEPTVEELFPEDAPVDEGPAEEDPIEEAAEEEEEDPIEEAAEEEEEAAEEELPNLNANKSELVAWAESKGLDVDGLTKREVKELILKSDVYLGLLSE